MRTTLTLDPDVEAMLAAYRKRHDLGLKEAINEALRQGLLAVDRRRTEGPRFATQVVDHGRAIVPNVDDVAEVLETVEEKPLR